MPKTVPRMPIANPFAYLMLALWPVVAWMFFQRLDPARALIWTVLGGYMLLPPVIAIDLPMIPDFDKYSIPNLAAAAAVVFLLKDRFSLWPDSTWARALIVLYVLGPFGTVLVNGDPLFFERSTIPAMRLYDSLAVIANQVITLLPFFLARKYLSDDQGLRAVVVALVLAGLIYSLPMFFEARMSPQLNLRIYGYFQHDFSQAVRFGGFRPFVFMPHGLWVAFFALMCLLAAATLFRIGPAAARPRQLVTLLYLAVLLLFCRSAGPVIYALVLLPVVLLLPARLQLMIAVAMAVMVITYPLLRGAHLVPLDDILSLAMSVNEERGQSLAFRFANEELLLARAELHPVFGWGGYGRNMLHDPVTGQISVIADGGWIITLGVNGWVGYIAEFGLLVVPVVLIAREGMARSSGALSPCLGPLALILAANLVDLLPNDTLIPFTWLLAGALMGYAESLARARRKRQAEAFLAEFRPGRTVI